MEKSKETKLIGVIASVFLLFVVFSAAFAYFGSFNVDLNNNVAVNINAVSPGNASFVSSATQLNLQVPAANMSQTAADNEIPAAENTAILTVNLTGAANLLTTCTYDIVYEYDTNSNVYGVSPTTKNGEKEITLQVSNVNGTNNFVTEKNFDSGTISSYKNGNVYTLVSGATIESDGTLITQNISITGKYYNLTISQSSLEGRAFTGKIYVTNHSCKTSETPTIPITTLMSTSTPDVYDENGLRYEGTNPNNYICLDNQKSGSCSDSSLLFRIIGLFDEDTSIDGTTSTGVKKLLKIIDTNLYSDDVWDENGNNNWNTASLKIKLNETYLTTLLGAYNINGKLESRIANAKWHLGGASDVNIETLTTEGIYTAERNIRAIYNGNPSSIYAKVGLMYPSDYGYATVGGTTTNKSSCRTKALYKWSDLTYSDCNNNDWLSVNNAIWSVSPFASSSDQTLYIQDNYMYHTYTGRSASVKPTFYLDAEALKIVGGSGTSDDPYHIG